MLARKLNCCIQLTGIMQDLDFNSCLNSRSVQPIKNCSVVWTVEALIYHHLGQATSRGTQHHRSMDTDQSPHQLSHSCLSLGPQVSPPSLPPCLLPAAPTGLPPSPHQLQPIPCSAGPSLCDPRGYRVREVRGGSPHCYPRHLSEVSVPETLRPCMATPTRPSTSLGRQGSPPF